jgi:hypothetical protein
MGNKSFIHLHFYVEEDYDPTCDGYILDIVDVYNGGVVNLHNIPYIYQDFDNEIRYYQVKKNVNYLVEMQLDTFDMYDSCYSITKIYEIIDGEIGETLEKFNKKVIKFELNSYI